MTKPNDDEYYSFDDEAVSSALEAARQPYEATDLQAIAEISSESGELSVLAQCISVTVRNRRVCLNLPLGLPRVCIPIPVNIKDGTAAQACLSICTFWGIPTGACVRVVVGGVVVVKRCFGRC
jgi:hypothetical protein